MVLGQLRALELASMVRGPRRGNGTGGRIPTDAERARADRKVARVTERTHSAVANGWVGPSILERLEAQLTESCTQYRVLRAAAREDAEGETDDGLTTHEWIERERHIAAVQARVARVRGEIRGVAIAIAMMRHPLKAYTTPWWNYVKKIEKRHMLKSKEATS